MSARNLPAVSATTLDRAIAWLSPGWALRRHRSRSFLAMSGAYDGARMDRAGGRLWSPSMGSADSDLQPDLPMLRRRTRDLDRNNPLARGALDTAKTSVVGPGLKPIPSIDRDYLGLDEDTASAIERQMMREWALFADNIECDITRTDRFTGLQKLAYRSAKSNGDAFAMLRMKERPGSPYALKIQLIEADQVCDPPRDRTAGPDGPRIVGGIEQDEDGAPVALWIADRHPGAYVPYRFTKMKWSRVPVFGEKSGFRRVLHLMVRNRIGQTRGEPWLAPVIESLKQVGRYTDAEIMAAVVNACFAVTTKTTDGSGMALTQTDGTDTKGDPINLTDPGMIVDLMPNEEVQGFTPGRPNTAFDPFMLAMMRNIGAGLGIPVELLIKHFTASYSASRAALLEAWRFYREEREWMVGDLCQPVREAALTEAVLRGRLVLPGFLDDPLAKQAWSACDWVGPAPGHIQPKQEAEAAKIRKDMGLTTLAKETAGYDGSSWESNHRQQVKEHQARKRDGLTAGETGPAPAVPALPEPDPDDEETEE